MSYQTSSKRSPPFWLLIGARKLGFFWHQSEGRTAATVWNWSGKTLPSAALLAALYFSFVPYFSVRLDFPSPPISAPGSPRMCLFTRQQPLKLGYFYWLRVKKSYHPHTELSLCYLKHLKFYLEHKASFIPISSIASFNPFLIAWLWGYCTFSDRSVASVRFKWM